MAKEHPRARGWRGDLLLFVLGTACAAESDPSEAWTKKESCENLSCFAGDSACEVELQALKAKPLPSALLQEAGDELWPDELQSCAAGALARQPWSTSFALEYAALSGRAELDSAAETALRINSEALLNDAMLAMSPEALSAVEQRYLRYQLDLVQEALLGARPRTPGTLRVLRGTRHRLFSRLAQDRRRERSRPICPRPPRDPGLGSSEGALCYRVISYWPHEDERGRYNVLYEMSTSDAQEGARLVSTVCKWDFQYRPWPRSESQGSEEAPFFTGVYPHSCRPAQAFPLDSSRSCHDDVIIRRAGVVDLRSPDVTIRPASEAADELGRWGAFLQHHPEVFPQAIAATELYFEPLPPEGT